MKKYIMALDAGTTSNRCILFNQKGEICSIAKKEFKQYYPQPGWVEHDANEIFKTQLEVTRLALKQVNATADQIAGIGITNQRETTIVWDRHTHEPIAPAIVWQCRRTSQMCDELKTLGFAKDVKAKTGLVIDAYFSATKIKWLLENVEGAKEKAQRGDLLFGTVETWLMYKLSGGQIHVSDYSNAARTMLYNIHTLEWDDEICEWLGIPKSMLPEVKPSSCRYGQTLATFFGAPIDLAGAAGDQQAALFGQMCWKPGDVKNTYGTGGFLLMNTGDKPIISKHGLVTTIAWGLNGKVTYALEGSVFVAGAAIQWLRDEMGIISCAAQSEEFALKVENCNGCYVVLAFTGLGAPYWDQYARGVIVGLTRGVNRYHITRATLDSIAYQVNDVLQAMKADAQLELKILKVDGGACANNYLMQTQADITNTQVVRPSCIESTALGAAYLAGLAVGYWSELDELSSNVQQDATFESQIDENVRQQMLRGWDKSVQYAFNWAREQQ